MAHITVRPAIINRIAGNCEDFVAPWVADAERALGDGASAVGAATVGVRRTRGGSVGTGGLEATQAAQACVTSWQETLGAASRAMRAVSGKLRGTAGAVAVADVDAADLYRGPVPDLPTVTVNLSR